MWLEATQNFLDMCLNFKSGKKEVICAPLFCITDGLDR